MLKLSNGDTLHGKLIGSPLFASGELVFTTGMVGYSEALTDPSYFGQVLVFTYPLIGNYGIPKIEDLQSMPRGFESEKIHASAVILSIDSHQAYHWNSHQNIDSWLKEHKVPGIVGVDTRHLVHLIRENPGLKCQVVPENFTGKRTFNGFSPFLEGEFVDVCEREILSHVSSKERQLFGKGKIRIGLIDCGVKWNIIRQLTSYGCEVEVLPWDTNLANIDCGGWLISNGPGDPKLSGNLIQQVRYLLTGNRPVLGICLGHQIVALAAGGDTKKMRYGHRSHNQPVREVGTRRGCMTSQNHGYEVDRDSLPEDWDLWFVNANDGSVEGIKHKEKPFRSVQFHPEAAGGPMDSSWIIKEFINECH